VTLRKLLSHRSGLTREAAAGGYLDPHAPPLAATVDGLGRSRLKATSDGSAYFYSNAGFAVVGRAIEIAAGLGYAELLNEALLAPLGLADSAIALTTAIRARLAPAMMWTAAGDAPAPLFDLGSAPAGNISASLQDLARWGQALLRGGDGLVSAGALAAMWTPAGADPQQDYGLGFALDRLDGERSVSHGGAVYGYSSAFTLLPDTGLGVAVVSTLDFTGELVGRLARRALRLALADRGLGRWPRPARRLPSAGIETAWQMAGHYTTPEGDVIELRPQGPRLILLDAGVPLEIRPVGPNRLALDGRLHGEETTHPFPIVETAGDGALIWKNCIWSRGSADPAPVPAELAAHVGDYDPVFMSTRLSVANGRLRCLVENLSPHECEPLGGNRFLMHGPMYEREILELGVVDRQKRLAIRVGEMILSRRSP
jgi:D-alanyl-D-alanine dipeptidase